MRKGSQKSRAVATSQQRLLKLAPAHDSVPPAPAPPVQHSLVVPAGSTLHTDTPGEVSVSDSLVRVLEQLGVEQAFAIFGGGIAPFCESLNRSSIRLMHFRHEASAAFAAIESSLASGKLTVVVATTGPGITNLYTGMVAARSEGAKVLFVSGATPAAQRGRGAFQETSYSSALAPLFTQGLTFHCAMIIESPAELGSFVSRIASGVTRPTGFVAHVGMPMSTQTATMQPASSQLSSVPPPVCDPDTIELCRELLAKEPFVIWAGFGARHAAEQLRELVICSPRGKGIMSE
jgi:acetolactate synthase-1/2/3 large subunit